MTADQYIAAQRAQAEQLAPAEAIDRDQFIYRASFYTLPTLRQASVRYISARGRNHKQVLSRFVEILSNPNVNRGDDYRLALGHIEATRRQMEANGL